MGVNEYLLTAAAHGLYDFCCTSDLGVAIAVFYGFVVFLYIYCFGKIKKVFRGRRIFGKLCGKYGFGKI